jgi:hypothetical protein
VPLASVLPALQQLKALREPELWVQWDCQVVGPLVTQAALPAGKLARLRRPQWLPLACVASMVEGLAWCLAPGDDVGHTREVLLTSTKVRAIRCSKA